MSDVACTSHSVDSDEFCNSRWFTRGWTLQELLVPTFLLVLNQSWQELGSRSTLASELEQATGISHSDAINFVSCSVATKMSWAAHRSTTRVEDEAYSLLGLFGINMALLYGEGTNAYSRLQQEIIRRSDDESIFAWSSPLETSRSALFARSPSWFRSSGTIEQTHEDTTEDRSEFIITNRGLTTNATLHQYFGTVDELDHLTSVEAETVVKRLHLWMLNCRCKKTRQRIGITLLKEADGRFVRSQWHRPREFGITVYSTNSWKHISAQWIYVRYAGTDDHLTLNTVPSALAITFLAPAVIRIGMLEFDATDNKKLLIYGPLINKTGGTSPSKCTEPVMFRSYHATASHEIEEPLKEIDIETEHSATLRFVQFSSPFLPSPTHRTTCALLICLWNKSPVIGLFQHRALEGQSAISHLEDVLVDIMVRGQDPQRLSDIASIPLSSTVLNLVVKCRPRPFSKGRAGGGRAAFVTLSLEACRALEITLNSLCASRKTSYNSLKAEATAQTEPDVDLQKVRSVPSSPKKSSILGPLRDTLRASHRHIIR